MEKFRTLSLNSYVRNEVQKEQIHSLLIGIRRVDCTERILFSMFDLVHSLSCVYMLTLTLPSISL